MAEIPATATSPREYKCRVGAWRALSVRWLSFNAFRQCHAANAAITTVPQDQFCFAQSTTSLDMAAKAFSIHLNCFHCIEYMSLLLVRAIDSQPPVTPFGVIVRVRFILMSASVRLPAVS